MLFIEEQAEYKPLFEAVGCICLCRNKILLLRRIAGKSYPGHWGIPSGRINLPETPMQAIIRELYEETGILQSSDNLQQVQSFHIVNNEMSYTYTVFVCSFDKAPAIIINSLEHDRFIWSSINECRTLTLVPNSMDCIVHTMAMLNREPQQLTLFPEPRNFKSFPVLESSIRKSIFSSDYVVSKKEKVWFVSLGAPATGKTTSLKAMARANSKLFLVEDGAILRSGSRLNKYLYSAFENRDIRFFFHFQMEVLAQRFWQSMNAPSNALVDETIFSTLAYSRALYRLEWLREDEYQTFFYNYCTYLKWLTDPCILYFRCDPDKIASRMSIRGRKVEELYSHEYICTLYEAFEGVARELEKDHSVQYIDTDALSTNEVVDRYAPKT